MIRLNTTKKVANKKLLNSYIWHCGCPNYQITAVVFFYFQVGWGGGGVVWGWLYLINSLQKTRQPPSCIVKFLHILASSCIHLIWLFFSCLKQRSFEWGRGGERGSDITKFFSNHSFLFFYYHKINLPVGQNLHLFFSLQVKCQILTCINFPKRTYIPIIWLLIVWERFIFQKT
jgi:hypothetical protein